ncbi:ABC transporter substrate-binding protein [Rhodococcus opacus]|nr:ABC transporter substrate-binding protein [Rhodococcus opacus]
MTVRLWGLHTSYRGAIVGEPAISGKHQAIGTIYIQCTDYFNRKGVCMHSQIRSSLVGITLGALTLVACTPGPLPTSSTAANPDNPVAVSMSVPASQWDPIATTNEVADNLYFSLVYDRLLTLDASGALVPQLAESYTMSEDNRQARFVIRPGAVFHDDSPVNADAVVANLQRAKASGKAVAANTLANVTDISTEGDLTVVIALERPDPAFPAKVATVATSIASPAAFADLGQKPVGSGPFRFVTSKADEVTTARFDGYWNTDPRAAEIVVKSLPPTNTRLNALRSGAVDWMFVNLDAAAEITQFAEDPNYSVIQKETSGVFALNLDTRDPVLADADVRKAISMAIDRESINTNLLGGMCTPTTQPLGSGPGHIDSLDETIVFDADQARSILKSKAPGGATINAVVASGTAAETIARALQAQLADVGVTLNVTVADARSARPDFRAGQFDGLVQAVNAEVDPLVQLQTNYAGPDAPGGADPQLQSLLAGAGTFAFGSPERTAALESASEYLAANPVHPVICTVSNTYIAGPSVSGVDDMPMSSVLNPADVRPLMR